MLFFVRGFVTIHEQKLGPVQSDPFATDGQDFVDITRPHNIGGELDMDAVFGHGGLVLEHSQGCFDRGPALGLCL